MSYAPVNNTIVFIGTRKNIVDLLNIGLKTSHLPLIDGKDYKYQDFIQFLFKVIYFLCLDFQVRSLFEPVTT